MLAQAPPLESDPARALDCLSLAAGREAAGLELEMGRRPGQSRVFVVAYSVSQETRELCSSYGIECFAVDHGLVRSWNGCHASAGPGS